MPTATLPTLAGTAAEAAGALIDVTPDVASHPNGTHNACCRK
jgi:hypothetical protein